MVEDERGDEPREIERLDANLVSRRAALALLSLGGTSALAGRATARSSRPWRTDVDANGNALFDLGGIAMRSRPTPITDFAGRNLAIDGDGNLNALGAGIADLDAGPVEERPPAGTSGRFFVAVDESLLYYDDGRSWVAIAGRGQPSVPLPDQYVRSLRAESLSVENVGASVYRSSDRVVFEDGEDPSQGDPRIDFDAKQFDQLGGFDAGPDAFTAPSDGLYEIEATATVTFQGLSQPIGVGVFVDDVRVAVRWNQPATLGPLSITVSDLLELTAGESVHAELLYDYTPGLGKITLRGGAGVTAMTVQRAG